MAAFTVLVPVSVQTCCSSRFPYDPTEYVYVLIENQVCINCRKDASDEFADTVTLLAAHKYTRMEASKSIYICAMQSVLIEVLRALGEVRAIFTCPRLQVLQRAPKMSGWH